jgi:hypothetical protein
MLTLLRKIRKSLIDSGAIQKYLLYALGEIALVVIGILLAIQINNGKIKKDNNELEKYYLAQVVSDISQTSMDLDEAINRAQARLLVGNNILKILGEDKFDLETPHIDSAGIIELEKILPSNISTLSSMLYRLKFVSVMDIRDTAFIEMTSSGNLVVITNENLRTEIIEFYAQLRDWAESNNFFRGAGNRYMEQLELAGIGLTDSDAEEIILNKLKSSPPLIAEIKSIITWANEQVYTYSRMKEFMNSFKVKIEQQLGL